MAVVSACVHKPRFCGCRCVLRTGLTLEDALAVAARYPTPLLLAEGYRWVRDVAAKQARKGHQEQRCQGQLQLAAAAAVAAPWPAEGAAGSGASAHQLAAPGGGMQPLWGCGHQGCEPMNAAAAEEEEEQAADGVADTAAAAEAAEAAEAATAAEAACWGLLQGLRTAHDGGVAQVGPQASRRVYKALFAMGEAAGGRVGDDVAGGLGRHADSQQYAV
jgi:hypothetical protein